MSTEKCEFCGLNLEGPCETPPPDTCGKALLAAQQQAESQLIYQEQVGNGLWQDVSKELHDAIKDGRVRGAVRTVRVTQQAEPGADERAACDAAYERWTTSPDFRQYNKPGFDAGYRAAQSGQQQAEPRAWCAEHQSMCPTHPAAQQQAEPSPFKRYKAIEDAGRQAAEETVKLHEYLAQTSGENAAQQQAEPGAYHVEHRTNACSEVVDKNGKTFATCAWSTDAAERAQRICDLLNGAAPSE